MNSGILSPDGRDIVLSNGVRVRLEIIRLRQAPAAAELIKLVKNAVPFATFTSFMNLMASESKVDGALGNLLNEGADGLIGLVENIDKMADCMEKLVGVPADQLMDMTIDDFMAIVIGFVSLNADFFIQRLNPILSKILAPMPGSAGEEPAPLNEN